MLSSAHDDEFGQMQRPLESADAPVSQSPYVIVTDVDAHHARALAAGAVIVMAPGRQGLRWSGATAAAIRKATCGASAATTLGRTKADEGTLARSRQARHRPAFWDRSQRTFGDVAGMIAIVA